jgi:hypothetical protein
MNRGRRSLLGMALLGIADPLLAGVPSGSLEQELGAIVRDPGCELASLAVLAIRDGKIAYQAGFWPRSAASTWMVTFLLCSASRCAIPTSRTRPLPCAIC